MCNFNLGNFSGLVFVTMICNLGLLQFAKRTLSIFRVALIGVCFGSGPNENSNWYWFYSESEVGGPTFGDKYTE